MEKTICLSDWLGLKEKSTLKHIKYFYSEFYLMYLANLGANLLVGAAFSLFLWLLNVLFKRRKMVSDFKQKEQTRACFHIN